MARATSCALLLGVLLVAAPAVAADDVKTSVEALGTVALGDGPSRAVSVEATYEEYVPASNAEWRRTLTRLRFRDGAGKLLYQETFETHLTGGEGFEFESSVGKPFEVRGAARRFLLLDFGEVPSAPTGGTWLVTYGFAADGRFWRFTPTFSEPGTRITNPTDESARLVRLRDGRYLDVAEWTGHFTLILGYQFEESLRMWQAERLCGRVEVQPREPESGTIELFRKPRPAAQDISDLRLYRKITVRPDSKVEFLEGCRRYPDPADGQPYVPWMRVRVDGEEGWVENEALGVLGLPAAD